MNRRVSFVISRNGGRRVFNDRDPFDCVRSASPPGRERNAGQVTFEVENGSDRAVMAAVIHRDVSWPRDFPFPFFRRRYYIPRDVVTRANIITILRDIQRSLRALAFNPFLSSFSLSLSFSPALINCPVLRRQQRPARTINFIYTLRPPRCKQAALHFFFQQQPLGS